MQPAWDALRQSVDEFANWDGIIDATRMGCAEAKPICESVQKPQIDATRMGCAEAKRLANFDQLTGKRMQPAWDALRQRRTVSPV